MTRLAILVLLATLVAVGARLAKDIPVVSGWLLTIGVIVFCSALVEVGKALLYLSRE